jgi:uncharacterized protein YndB with AHSA1/START domain
MIRPLTFVPDPALDLVLERVVDVPPALVWTAWTTPDILTRWFTPKPWTTASCDVDLRPGGLFRTVMRSPDGRDFPNVACYLEIVPGERLVWTTALGPGYRPTAPATPDHLALTAVISMTAHGAGTKYTALVMHADRATRERHGEMGFQDGWGTALAQLVEVARTL